MTAPQRAIVDYSLGIFDGPHATPQESSDGPVFLGIKNITAEGRLDLSVVRHVSEQEFPRWTRRVLPRPGDVVFTYEATLHRYAIIPEGFRGCLGRRVALLRPDPDKADPRYLLYYFLSPDWRATVQPTVMTGATVDRIPLEKFPSLPARLPDVTVQRRIADVLGAYDDLIENNRRRMVLLEEAARQLYREWFVRLRFPGHEHTRVTEGVPERWCLRRLGECLTLNYGKALKADDRVSGDIAVFGSSGVVGCHDEHLSTGPGIILGRKGNVGSVYWSHGPFWAIDTVYFVSAEQSDLYYYYALSNMSFINTDGAVPGLNRDFAYSRQVLVPPTQLRRIFLEQVAPMHAQTALLQKMDQKVRAARDLLLPRLMSGEIAV